jgi:nitroreductase
MENTMGNRDATPLHPINELLVKRHSPYAFDPERPVAQGDLDALLEAARWTMSSYNAQPWRYIVGVKNDGTDTWGKIHACLVEGNQPWAINAPVLALGLVKTTFDYNGKPNAAAEHDLGAASAMLTVEAVARGLCVHQMIGIEPDKVIATFDPGEDIKPLTGLAIGYVGDPAHVPAAYAERDAAPRERLPLAAILLSDG